MTEQEFAMPMGEEAKWQQGEFSPLPADDYIIKVAKIELEKKPTWNQAVKKFNYDDLELQYTLVCLPYKLKWDEWLFYKGWKEAKPLWPRLWRGVSPFSMGTMKNGEPTFLRSFTAYAQGLDSADINTVIPMPGIIVLNRDEDIVSDEIASKYKEQFKQYRLDKDETAFTLKKDGYKHIVDIIKLEWKYIWARIVLDEKGRNKITGFSKLPSSFKPDANIEAEAMKKFSDSYKKVIDKRKEKEDITPEENTTTVETVNASNLPF